MHRPDFLLGAAAIACLIVFTSGCVQSSPGNPPAIDGEPFAGVPSEGLYRLPYADDTRVRVFDYFQSHRPQGRLDLFAISGERPHALVAAAAGRIIAIRDNFSEQQSGRAAAICHNNFVWIAHENGEWTGYSHMAQHSVTGKAKLHVGDTVKAGQYLGDEAAVGCAMLEHLHFEVGAPGSAVDEGGFLVNNDKGSRNRSPRFCGVPGESVVKDSKYIAGPCPKSAGESADSEHPVRYLTTNVLQCLLILYLHS
jgi:murein DD-endopeptidase MepM/ murein hydrolase activator NlpD